MWCAAKGINCPDCGVFGECQRTCCGLPNAEPSTLGTSSSYLVNTTSQKLITDIRYEAVKEFAEKVKGEVYPFLQAEMYNKKHFITGHLISDKLLENQNIGILKAQDVLSKWFKVKIDELLKEYEE